MDRSASVPNVSLGPHFEAFIAEQITQGRFQNASEVVRAGLRMLEDHEMNRTARAARLVLDINLAFDELGPDIPGADVFEKLEARYRADTATPRDA
jgi:antitoxin ParD1/3/4